MNWFILQGGASVLYFVMILAWVWCFSSMCKREKVSVICWMTCIALLMFSFGLAAGKRYVLHKLTPPITQK